MALQSEEAFSLIWLDNKMPNPYPITFSVLRLEWILFGENANGFRWVNIGLHLLNLLLFWCFLKRLQVPEWAIFFAVIFYGIHPVQVESVMWISEVKNLLSATFYWLSFWAFLNYLDGYPHRRVYYAAGFLMFTLSLASKSMTVTFPVSLALWIFLFYRKEFWKKNIVLLPLWGLSLFFGIVSMLSEHRYYTTTHDMTLERSLFERCHDVAESLYFYLWKFFYPVNLACIYPHNSLMKPGTWLSSIGMVGILLLVVGIMSLRVWKPKVPKLVIFSVLNYGIVASPILGFLSTSFMPLSKVSDRYNYHPLPFLLIALGYGISFLFSKMQHMGKIFFCFFLLLLVSFAGHYSLEGISVWTNSIRLWTQTIKVYPKSAISFYNLGVSYWHNGEFENAEQAYLGAIKIAPEFYKPYSSYGCLLLYQGRIEEGKSYLNRAKFLFPKGQNHFMRYLSLNPNEGKGWYSLGVIHERLEDWEHALFYYEKAKNATSPEKQACFALGKLSFKLERFVLAKECFQEALQKKIEPAWSSLYLAWLEKDPVQKIYYAKKTLDLKPEDPEIWQELILLHETFSEKETAFVLLIEALKRFPKNKKLNLLWARFWLKRTDVTRSDISEIVHLLEKWQDEKDPEFLTWYTFGLAILGDFDKALLFSKSIQKNNAESASLQVMQKDLINLLRIGALPRTN